MKKLICIAILAIAPSLQAAERKPLFEAKNAISLAFEDNRMEHNRFVDKASTQTITGFKYFDGKVELSTITVTSATVTNLTVTNISGNWNGWTASTHTATRTGNHTFTIAADVTGWIGKGTRIRYKESGGSNEYGVVISASYSSPNTTVTLATNTDYTMAATPTEMYFSHGDPSDYPDWFNTAAPTWVVGNFDNSGGGQPDTIISRFKITGRMVTVYLRATGHKATTNKYINFNPSAVYPAATTVVYAAMGSCFSSAADDIGVVMAYNSTTDWYFIFDATIADNTVLSNGVSGIFSYQF